MWAGQERTLKLEKWRHHFLLRMHFFMKKLYSYEDYLIDFIDGTNLLLISFLIHEMRKQRFQQLVTSLLYRRNSKFKHTGIEKYVKYTL